MHLFEKLAMGALARQLPGKGGGRVYSIALVEPFEMIEQTYSVFNVLIRS